MPVDTEVANTVANTLVIELSPATTHLVESMFAEAHKRGEKEVRYMKEVSSFVEVLLDYAYRRKTSEWESRDKQQVGKILREALDKMVNHKPLSKEETALVQKFQAASV
jgi:hypothetical protein